MALAGSTLSTVLRVLEGCAGRPRHSDAAPRAAPRSPVATSPTSGSISGQLVLLARLASLLLRALRPRACWLLLLSLLFRARKRSLKDERPRLRLDTTATRVTTAARTRPLSVRVVQEYREEYQTQLPTPITPNTHPTSTYTNVNAMVPRPLQLATAVSGSSSASGSSSPLPTPGSALPTPLRSAGVNLNSPGGSQSNRRNPTRRQSSIAYFSPSDEGQRVREAVEAPPGHVGRSASLSVKVNGNGQETRKQRPKTALGLESMSESVSPRTERGPLTLAEKHADLLSFIAQKEAKCMELRAQLATHEAELAELKRKWERIVHRGIDRAYSTNLSSSSATPVNGANGDMSLQGMGRMLVAGLADLSASPKSATSPSHARSPSTTTSHQSISSVSTLATTSSSGARSGRSSLTSFTTSESPAEEREKEWRWQDTGATPTMTPTQVTATSKLQRRRSREPSASPSAALFAVLEQDATSSEQPKPKSPPTVHSKRAPSPPRQYQDAFAGVAGGGVGDWVGTVGRKLGKDKNIKRASLLLSDVGQSLFAALASPGPSTPGTPMRTPSGLFESDGPSSKSLLDDDEGGMGGDVLVPTRTPAPSMTPLTPAPAPLLKAVKPAAAQAQARKKKASTDDFDDWNW